MPGTFRAVTAEFKEPAVAVEGELFVADGGDIMGVVNDSRRFISLRDVRFLALPEPPGHDRAVETYGYLAIGKQQAHLIRF